MSRPLRIEFPGAIYYVTSRGDRREPIFVDDGDRAFVERMQALAEAPRRQAAEVPRAQRKATVTMSALLAAGVPRPAALRRAHVDSGVTMTALAAEVGSCVSCERRLIAKEECGRW